MDNNQRQKMERWADRGEHGGATALMDRLSSSLSSSSAPLVPERRVRPLHGFVVAAGAAVLTVVVIVAGVLAVRLGPEDEVATPDSAPAPVDVVTTVPAPDAGNVATTQPTTPIAESVVPADIDLTTWAEVPLNSDVFGYEPVYDAEWVDGVLYAVGSSNEEEGEFASFRGTVWRSPDGITWERTATVSDPGSVMYAITGSDTTLVAVGEDRTTTTSLEDQTARVRFWRSRPADQGSSPSASCVTTVITDSPGSQPCGSRRTVRTGRDSRSLRTQRE